MNFFFVCCGCCIPPANNPPKQTKQTMSSPFPRLAELEQQYNVAKTNLDEAKYVMLDAKWREKKAWHALHQYQLSIRSQCVHVFEKYSGEDGKGDDSEGDDSEVDPDLNGDGQCVTCGRKGSFDAKTGTWTKFYIDPKWYDCRSACVCCNGIGTIYSDDERSDIDENERHWRMPTPENNYNSEWAPAPPSQKKRARGV